LSRTLYIHVGPSKTGTSALQAVLQAHDNSVVIYPKAGQWKGGAHHNLVYNYVGQLEHAQATHEDIDGLFASIAAEARGSQLPVLISSELLSGQRNSVEFIEMLKSRLDGDFEVEILFTVREHFDRAASDYNQRVKAKGLVEGPDKFLAGHTPGLCYEPMLRRVIHPDFRITLIPYHPAPGFVGRFLRHVGFPQDKIPEVPFLNQSIDVSALIATLAMNRVAPKDRARTKIVKALRELRKVRSERRAIFGWKTMLRAEERIRVDRDFLRSEFGFELPSPDLTGAKSAFWITEEERAAIAGSVSGSHPQIVQFRKTLRKFVRDDQAAESLDRSDDIER
jgi:hypothetical protein